VQTNKPIRPIPRLRKQPTAGIQRLVLCPACDKPQPDLGRRQTCVRCGCFPLPSYDYDPDSSFYPKQDVIPPKNWRKTV
jgi:hypothetical protein